LACKYVSSSPSPMRSLSPIPIWHVPLPTRWPCWDLFWWLFEAGGWPVCRLSWSRSPPRSDWERLVEVDWSRYVDCPVCRLSWSRSPPRPDWKWLIEVDG
jgi:hypothetical protein